MRKTLFYLLIAICLQFAMLSCSHKPEPGEEQNSQIQQDNENQESQEQQDQQNGDEQEEQSSQEDEEAESENQQEDEEAESENQQEDEAQNSDNQQDEDDADIGPKLDYITVIGPTKVVYYVGDRFEPEGMVVTAYYDDGTDEVVEDYKITGFDSSVANKQLKVTVSYTYNNITKNKTLTLSIEDIPTVQLKYISITKVPKLTYAVGEEFDYDGLEVIAYFDNGNSQIIEDYTLTGFDSTKVNDSQVITISYKFEKLEKTESITVKIVDYAVFSIDEHFQQYQDIEGMLRFDTKTKAFVALDEYEEYTWWLDGKKLDTDNAFLKITTDLINDNKTHVIMVVCKDDKGVYYTATKLFSL